MQDRAGKRDQVEKSKVNDGGGLCYSRVIKEGLCDEVTFEPRPLLK